MQTTILTHRSGLSEKDDRELVSAFVAYTVSATLWLLFATAIGVLLGLGVSAAVSRLLARFLFGLSTIDPVTFATSALILCVAAIVASYLPARRAAKVDPLVALRAGS